MRHDVQVDLIERLLRVRKEGAGEGRDFRLDARMYTSPEIAEGERRALFRREPLVLAHASELPAPGDFVTADVAGVPLVLVRGDDGAARGFVNACRHRGSRVVTEPRGNTKKAMVCRYHAWTYDLRGRLAHVPHRATFPTLDCAGLLEVPLEERHGLLWGKARPIAPGTGDATGTGGAALDVGAHLGPLDDDLAAFGLATHHAQRKVVETRACNWKLVIEAFLEGYHAKFLHQRTIARFFLDGCAFFEILPPHVRSVGGRRELAKAEETPRDRWRIRDYATVFYFLFPSTVLVFHPDWVSLVTMSPRTLDTSTYTHTMLVPEAPRSDEERAHWDKTWALIEDAVFQREDLSIAESIQSTLASGLEPRFWAGSFEEPLHAFHESIRGALGASPA